MGYVGLNSSVYLMGFVGLKGWYVGWGMLDNIWIVLDRVSWTEWFAYVGLNDWGMLDRVRYVG